MNWTYITTEGRLTHPLPSLSSGSCTLQRCYHRGAHTRSILPLVSLLRFYLILMKLPVYSTHLPKSRPPVRISFKEMRYTTHFPKVYQSVNCRSISREEIHVYPPPHWTGYLPSQTLYGKKLCRSLYPPFHNFTNHWWYMRCEWIMCSSTTCRRTYCLIFSILVDIQHILSSNDPVNISDDTVDRRLDDFLLQFQVSTIQLKLWSLLDFPIIMIRRWHWTLLKHPPKNEA